MRAILPPYVRACRRGGTPPTVIIAGAAGLLLVVLVVWLAWPHGKPPPATDPTHVDAAPAVRPTPDVNSDAEPIDEPAAWPEDDERTSNAPDTDKPIRHDRDVRGGESIDDEPAEPREPASAYQPPDLAP